MPNRISKECKYFKTCKDKSCVKEFHSLYGRKIPKNATIIWSIELCYALKELEKAGLIKYA